MKKLILSMIVSLASLIAFIGIYPTSWVGYYQPQIPKELIK
nr:cyclic lactone autoinducer peptide [Pelotomaculum schinkii]